MSGPRVPGLFAASALFVLSGATALAYEVVWFKRLSQVFGSSSLAHAAVVTGFLAGLGLGAWLLGRLADRLADPLRGYAMCEAGIGVLALLLPFELGWLAELAPLTHRLAEGRPLVGLGLRLLGSFAVLGPPCLLMGATLPMLTRYLARAGLTLGASTAWLYALNALGAAAGALVAGFLLLPAIGLAWTNTAAALLNFAIAGTVFLLPAALRRSAGPAASRLAEPEPSPPGARVPLRAVHASAALMGAAALALQILWTRQLGVVLGGTTYAFTAVLAVFIAGLGLGSLVFRLGAGGRPVRALVSAAVLVLVVSGLVGRALFPGLAWTAGALLPLRVDPLANAGICVGSALAIQGLPTLCMGLLFPALVALTRMDASRAGRAVGDVYAWNTVGSIGGAVGGALLLLPRLGSHSGVAVALGAYAVALLVLYPPVSWQTSRASLPAAALALIALLLPWPDEDPRVTNFGMYVYGPRMPADLAAEFEVLSFAEGRTCNVLVLQHPLVRNLRVNGKVDASDADADMVTQLGLAALPRCLRPDAREVLVIGFGSGVTPGVSLLFPGTRVTCCEIEPQVLAASRWFHAVNHRPEASPHYVEVVDDGRNYVQGTEARFDLVLSAPSNPWIAGVANLFTLEFYRAVRERLAPGGLLAQWMQNYAVSANECATVVRTVSTVFPHCALLRLGDGDTIVLASEQAITPGSEALDAAQRAVDGILPLRADLERVYGTADVRSLLLSHLVWEEADVARFLAEHPDAPVHTDVNLTLEFEAPRHLFAAGLPGGSRQRELVQQAILAAARPAAFGERFARWGSGPAQVPALRRLGLLYARHGLYAHATAVTQLARSQAPDDPELTVDAWLLPGAPLTRESGVFATDVERLVRDAPHSALRLAVELARRGRSDPARVTLERLVAVHPASATAWAELALLLEETGQPTAARAALERALASDPLDRRARDLAERLHPEALSR